MQVLDSLFKTCVQGLSVDVFWFETQAQPVIHRGHFEKDDVEMLTNTSGF